MGHALQAGCGQCPAKQAAVFAGLPKTIEATTVNKVCASGLKAVCTAAQDIAQGYAAVVVAGGMESMSNVPRYQKKRLGKSKDVEIDCKRTVDGLEDGLLDPYTGLLMGACAEQVVTTYEISRNAQDDYALASYNRAIRALEYKKFCAEITILQGEMGPIDADEARAQATFLRLSELSPVFTSSGSITCGNACSMADGAAAVVLADEKTISKVKLAAGPFARIVSFADAAEEPQNFALAPSRAIKSALERANLLCQEITRWEINEAFAAVVLVNQKVRRETNFVFHTLTCSSRFLISILRESISMVVQLYSVILWEALVVEFSLVCFISFNRGNTVSLLHVMGEVELQQFLFNV